jgi:hypothetical protein
LTVKTIGERAVVDERESVDGKEPAVYGADWSFAAAVNKENTNALTGVHASYTWLVNAIMKIWRNSVPVRAVIYVSVALVILGFAPSKMSPFIYFQF